MTLADDLMDMQATPPLAAKPKAMRERTSSTPSPGRVKKVPLQILVTPEDAKAIKRAALGSRSILQRFHDIMFS
jgi:hypothetical protein